MKSRNIFFKKLITGLCIIIRKKIIIGSGLTSFPGWVSTDIDILNITSESDWKRILSFCEINAVLMEHVLEHLTEEDAMKGLKNIFNHLRKGGHVRIAVPDGFHSDQYYIEKVKPGGIGTGAEDHKILYNYKTLSELMKNAGFECDLLEYWDEAGEFHHKDWYTEDGMVMRSLRFDKRNIDGKPVYTSLIIDGFKSDSYNE